MLSYGNHSNALHSRPVDWFLCGGNTGSYASPKLLSTNDYLLFPYEECQNAAKTELMTPGDFYQINNNNSNNLFLHMNISSVSYHIDDLNTFIINCKNKPKVIGIQSAE